MTKGYPRVLLETQEASPTQHQDSTKLLNTSKKLLQKTAFSLIPTFIQRRLRSTSSNPYRIHATSYLDGLRGVASLIVFMGHYTEENLGWYQEPYGLYEDGAPSSPLQLPFLRVLYSARPMVHIFFIISGFVLSYKPLKQIHGQQHAALASTLSSSIFRRGNRLFLPSLGILLIMAISVYYQVSDGRYAPAYFSLHDQLSHWWSTSFGLLGASFAIDNIEYPQPEYNPALWTIPVEFAQSLLLFIALLGLARCRIYLRLLLNCLLIGICFRIGVLYTVEFLGGMFIAEITLIQDRLPFSPSSSPTMLPKYELEDKLKSSKCGSTVKENLIKTFWIANMISGLFIASWPNDHVDELWGLRILDAHTPKPYEGQRVWFAFGAFQIVIACTQLSFLQNLFNTPVAQYLGEISYALYLTHNLCLTILEPRFMPLLETSFSKATFWGRHAIWAVGLTIYLPIILMVADLYMRAADKPSVKFARWLEDKCIVAPKKT